MLDHDNSTFLSIHSLRGTVHTFIRKYKNILYNTDVLGEEYVLS